MNKRDFRKILKSGREIQLNGKKLCRRSLNPDSSRPLNLRSGDLTEEQIADLKAEDKIRKKESKAWKTGKQWLDNKIPMPSDLPVIVCAAVIVGAAQNVSSVITNNFKCAAAAEVRRAREMRENNQIDAPSGAELMAGVDRRTADYDRLQAEGEQLAEAKGISPQMGLLGTQAAHLAWFAAYYEMMGIKPKEAAKKMGVELVLCGCSIGTKFRSLSDPRAVKQVLSEAQNLGLSLPLSIEARGLKPWEFELAIKTFSECPDVFRGYLMILPNVNRHGSRVATAHILHKGFSDALDGGGKRLSAAFCAGAERVKEKINRGRGKHQARLISKPRPS